MIHKVTVSKGSTTLFSENTDTGDTVTSVEVGFNEHYGVRVVRGTDGRAWLQFREGAGWTEPVAGAEFVRAQVKNTK